MTCPRCGAATAGEARFCPKCGTALDAGGPTGADDQVTVPAPSPGHQKRPASSGWLSSSDSIDHGRFPPGTVLDGRYRIIGMLGRGGMGEVYRADDLRLGQPVALKFLPDAVGADPVRLAQFHNEVRIARQVSHPNICRVYDIGEVDGHLFLSMEFVTGEDLATSLRRIGRFPEDKATDIARQLCAGIAAAHERGVLHRDLKPANVMLDAAGHVRLMDFGLAAIGTADDIRAGTPAYMAPEQLFGREVTARSDIYALGLVLYELFTGRRAFTAATLNDLVEQHQSGQLTPPREIVSTLDPTIERAILRCLDADPGRRPSTAIGVSAALPGGDPLAAALAAGETPSPEMVAAAGEGAGLSVRVAVSLLVAVLIGTATIYVMALRNSATERIRPELTPDVLVQKARDAIRQLGYVDKPGDEAYGLTFDETIVDYAREHETASRWQEIVSQRPSPLVLWYRRSQEPMFGSQFHHDLLTPGIVSLDDPAPTSSGMIQVQMDHQGRLISLEAIPAQVQETPGSSTVVDWRPLLALADLDLGSLQQDEPKWTWLATSDTRAAWTGVWPGNQRPLRVEAAAFRGRPVAFQLSGPWTKPSRTPSGGSGQESILVVILFLLALSIVIGGGVLAHRNLRAGRGDPSGALTLGSAVAAALWVLWACQTHISASIEMLGSFLIAICTTVFYAVLFWTIYLAIEPFVRRYWPQALVSWTRLLDARVRDPIVGRDVLIGVTVGVLMALLIEASSLIADNAVWPPGEIFLGTRSAVGEVLMHGLYAMRTSLFVFFLLFLLRVVLRNQWAATIAFVSIFTVLNTLTSEHLVLDGVTTILSFTLFAVAVVRWGLTTLTVAVMAADLLLVAPATTDLSAWYISEAAFALAIPLLLASWAAYTSSAFAASQLRRDRLRVSG